MCRNYGPNARTALQSALKNRWCTQESFTQFINDTLAEKDERITRATVANWSIGRENMPADALILLAEHVGEDHKAAVLDVFVRGAGVRAEAIPEATGTAAGAVMELVRSLGEVGPLLDAIDPEGPGGREITPEEWATVGPCIDRTQVRIDRVKAHQPNAQPSLIRRGAAS